MVNGPLPVLVTVRVCAALVVPTAAEAKVRFDGLMLATPATPVPLIAIAWGLPWALSLIVTVPIWVPIVVGTKVTEMLQAPLAGTLEQLLA
jgi:hypothetical protein